jgi:hypothetical protein
MLRDDGLTTLEGHVMDSLTNAVHHFANLEHQHPQEWAEFIRGIHQCQDILACRIARREYPAGWPTYTITDDVEEPALTLSQ